MARVVVVGSSNTDLTMLVPALPSRGETVLGGSIYQAAGGKGANQAVAAARAGAEVAMVAATGDDDFGRAAVALLDAEGIATKSIVLKRGAASGVALIMVEEQTGENLIGVTSGANLQLTPADVAKAAPAIRRAGVLLLQLEIPLAAVEHAARIARAAGVPVILNPAPMPARGLPRSLLANIDYLVPNRVELARLAERLRAGTLRARPFSPFARLFRLGVTAVIVTLGARGARIVTPDGATGVPALPATPVDTVGAGDCFCGYLAAGIAEGQPLADAARLACAAASISVTRRGAQPSIPTRAEVERLLRRTTGRKEN